MSRLMPDYYIRRYYHAGFGALGGVAGQPATGDFVSVYAQQRNEARKLFGSTSRNLPGRTDIQYPNVSGSYAIRLLAYWRGEAGRIAQHAEVIPDSALRSQWLRAVQVMNTGVEIGLFEALARGAGNSPFPSAMVGQVVDFWDTLDAVVLPMRGIKETPSIWTLAVEAIQETLPDNPAVRGINSILTAAKILGAGLIVYVAYDALTKRGR